MKKDQQTQVSWKNLLFPFKPSLIILIKVLLQESKKLPAAVRRALWKKWHACDIKFQESKNKWQLLVLKSLNFLTRLFHLSSHLTYVQRHIRYKEIWHLAEQLCATITSTMELPFTRNPVSKTNKKNHYSRNLSVKCHL